MARMIPASISTNYPSPGEREIFENLKGDPATHDWTVLHSLDVAHHLKQISGEIDFVIIVPSKGVLCLEVKACTQLRRDGGVWYYGSDPNPDTRGPFKQASQGMHSIRKRLIAQKPHLSRVVFWSAVVFPYIEFDASSVEWHSWQVISASNYRKTSTSSLFLNVLERARSFLRTRPTASWFEPDLGEPTNKQCGQIVEVLRPDFEFFEPPKLQAIRRSDEIKRYTQEQFGALDSMEANPRVIFTGPAGTGKTLLAIEAARRSGATGKRILLLCFNRLLGRWLEEQTADLRPQVITATLHKHMLRVAGRGVTEENPPPGFWEIELPRWATDKLLEDDTGTNIFDEIIVDEAQDILAHRSYIDFLDLSLKGGLTSGRFRFFGDFEKQAIYKPSGFSFDELFQTGFPQVPFYSLRVNCRNTPRVAELVHLLCGLTPRYARVLRPDDSIEPELHYYRDQSHQRSLLLEALEKLRRESFSGQNIVILSPKADSNCTASALGSPWKERLRPVPEITSNKQSGYCSIYAFKGLEAPAIIVIDVEKITGPDAISLFYVAITRALHRIIILVDQKLKDDLLHILLKSQ